MPEVQYDHFDWRPQDKFLATVYQANLICEDFRRQDYDLTLRQLYYQFVSQDLIPNNEKSYNNLGNTISKARMAGMLNWDFIDDRGRIGAVGLTTEPTVEEAFDRAADRHWKDLWVDQETRVEVWVEKDALKQVVDKAAGQRQVDTFACKGYVSASAMWRAGQRFTEYAENGQNVVVLHLGDHDPSGIDMTRDIRDRLSRFMVGDAARANRTWGYDYEVLRDTDTITDVLEGLQDEYDLPGAPLTVKRIALNMDQIEQYAPPPNPTKLSDSRSKEYIRSFGYESWELDALNPSVLSSLILEEIDAIIDPEKFTARFRALEAERVVIREAAAGAVERLRADEQGSE